VQRSRGLAGDLLRGRGAKFPQLPSRRGGEPGGGQQFPRRGGQLRRTVVTGRQRERGQAPRCPVPRLDGRLQVWRRDVRHRPPPRPFVTT
jgi:hypothetical protein